jgi:spore coat polysaccharide biosynthesis protein SpsF
MSSSRLPGKVMMQINGKPMIYWQIQRLLESKRVITLVVATSIDSTDDALVEFLQDYGVNVYRGSLENVLCRFIEVSTNYSHDALIRLTGDCPLIMPELLDQMIDKFYEDNVDYLSNTLDPTFPDGLDIEILKQGVLEKLATFELEEKELEHVTLGIYNRPEIFNLSNFFSESNRSLERWTVDYQEDLDFIESIFKEFSGRETVFSYQEVCDFLDRAPEHTSQIQGYKRNEQLQKDKNHG